MILSTTPGSPYALFPSRVVTGDTYKPNDDPILATTSPWYNEKFGKPFKFYENLDSVAGINGFKLPIEMGPNVPKSKGTK